MSYLGLQDLRIPFGEETSNPVLGFSSPGPPTPQGHGVFQGLRQAVSSSPRASHQQAGQLELGGILYPLQDTVGSQAGAGPTQALPGPHSLSLGHEVCRSCYLQHLLVALNQEEEHGDVDSGP